MVHLTTALDASSGVPLYEQLYRSLAGEMRSGTLAAGTRMPGKRRLAAELSVSVNTVDAAYQILATEGYMEPRERSGFYVQEYLALPTRPEEVPPPVSAAPQPEAAEPPVRFDLSTRVHAPGGEVIADGPLFRYSLSLRRRGGRGALGQSQILLYIKAAPLPRLQIALRCQHLIGRVHRVHRDGKLCRQTPLAGHPRPRRDSPRPHLGGEAAVELLIKRHIGCRVQRCRQMDHKKPLLFSQCAKLTP